MWQWIELRGEFVEVAPLEECGHLLGADGGRKCAFEKVFESALNHLGHLFGIG